jgi:hypothetical protein
MTTATLGLDGDGIRLTHDGTHENGRRADVEEYEGKKKINFEERWLGKFERDSSGVAF